MNHFAEPPATSIEAMGRYCDCMEEVKLRLSIVDVILEQDSVLSTELLDGELACFQLRRVLEQIAFSSLCVHRDIYQDARKDLETAWRAKGILTQLQLIHPEFYPRPAIMKKVSGNPVLQLVSLDDGFLTISDFEFLYDRCSDLIHSWNPFSTRERMIDFERPLKDWVNRIKMLLNFHYVHLHGVPDLWVVQMVGEDAKVQAMFAPRIGEMSEELLIECGLRPSPTDMK